MWIDQSVRGYGYKKIGPVDSEGNVVGGKNLLTYSVELERSIYFRLKEGKGYETRVPLFLGAAGLLVSFHSFELTWFEGFYNHLEMSQYVTLTIFQENYRDTVSLLFFGVVLYFCFYLLRMYCFISNFWLNGMSKVRSLYHKN